MVVGCSGDVPPVLVMVSRWGLSGGRVLRWCAGGVFGDVLWPFWWCPKE